jgi:hypothetical protein
MTTDAQILSALREEVTGGVSGAEAFAAAWREPRGDLGAHPGVAQTRLRYRSQPAPGYRLLSAPDLLHADDLMSRLGKTKIIGRDIRVFERTTSTTT